MTEEETKVKEDGYLLVHQILSGIPITVENRHPLFALGVGRELREVITSNIQEQDKVNQQTNNVYDFMLSSQTDNVFAFIVMYELLKSEVLQQVFYVDYGDKFEQFTQKTKNVAFRNMFY